MKSDDNIDKRRHERLQQTTTLVDFSDGKLFLHGDIKDISLGGMQIECLRGVEPGTEITVALSLGNNMKLKGVVRWANKKGVKHFLGIQFLKVTPEQESGIREIIQALFWKTARA